MKDSYDFSKAKRGPIIQPTGKTRISIFIDDDVIEAFREKANSLGKGYQTMINDALRAALSPESQPVTQGVFESQLNELATILRTTVSTKKTKSVRVTPRVSGKTGKALIPQS